GWGAVGGGVGRPARGGPGRLDGKVARGPTGAWSHPALTTLLMLVALGLGAASSGVATLVTCAVLLFRRGPAPLAAFGVTTAVGALSALVGGRGTSPATPLGVASLAGASVVGGLVVALAITQLRPGE